MAAHKGSKLKIKKAGVVICSGINSKDINLNAELIDNTAGSNRSYRVFLPVTDTKSIDVGFKGIAKDRVLRKLRLNDNNLLQNVTIEFANGDTVTGNFMLGNYSESNGFKDAIEFSCDLQSTGAYTKTFSATENDDGSVVDDGGVEFEGLMRLIGRFYSAGISDGISGQQICGAAPTYDFATGEIEHIYQRYRICDSPLDVSEYPNFSMCAVDRNFAVCCELNGANIAITPYNVDEGLKVGPELWGADCTLIVDTDVSLIICNGADEYAIADVIVINPGRLLVSKTKSNAGQTSWTFEIVSYSSPLINSTVFCVVDLVDLGYSDYFYRSSVQNSFAFNIVTKECTGSFPCYSFLGEDSTEFTLFINFDPDTGDVLSHSMALLAEGASPLVEMSVINGDVFEFNLSSFYYGVTEASYGGYKIGYTTNSYGKLLEYKTYATRSLIDQATEYADLSANIQIETPPIMSTKLTALGFVVDDGEFWPRIGAIGIFIK